MLGFRRGSSIPRTGLLFYASRPNSDEYLIGEDTEVGEDTYIWGYYAGTSEAVRAATGWTTGNGNALYDDAGSPRVALSSGILADAMTNQIGGLVFFQAGSVEQQTGKLAIYSSLSEPDEAKLLKWAGVA
jgi:hypothetical protein